MATTERNGTVKETIINCLEAASLRGISTRHFIELKRMRELYERRIEEKGRQSNKEIVPTSIRALVEAKNLKIFIAAGWIEASSIDGITKRQMQECVEK